MFDASLAILDPAQVSFCVSNESGQNKSLFDLSEYRFANLLLRKRPGWWWWCLCVVIMGGRVLAYGRTGVCTG